MINKEFQELLKKYPDDAVIAIPYEDGDTEVSGVKDYSLKDDNILELVPGGYL